VHGASLGEFITLKPFIKQLAKRYGKDRIVCTATTMDGLNQLRRDECCRQATLLPIELPACTLPFVDKIKPRVLLVSETEIWPLLMATLARKNVPYGIINGRINEKTVRFMRMFWPLFSAAIDNLSFVFPQENHYKRRFKILGVAADKMKNLGSFKYDFIDVQPDKEAIRQQYGIPAHRPVICFGSTHPREEKIILDALENLWPELQATVIIAPRHIKRAPEVCKLLKDRNLDYSLATRPAKIAPHIILVDTLGELRNFYAISSLAFVGGSLIKHGGHNLLEPAAFSLPILTGPETFNFRYEMRALHKQQAVKVVKDASAIEAELQNWLSNPQDYVNRGKRARKVLDEMAGAGNRTIKELEKLNILP
jgi:3-deoxy-D-manno-octulosonic-acid transferase